MSGPPTSRMPGRTSAPPGERAPDRAVTLRAVLLGLGCVAFLSLVTPYCYLVLQGSEIAANHLPAGALVIFLLLVAVLGGGIRWLQPRLLLSRGETLLVYVMMLVASAVPARAFLAYVLTVPAGGFYYAHPENRWPERLLPYMKPWLAPRDPEVIRTFYEGLPPGRGIPWGEWLVPMLAWGLFFLFFVLTCLSLGLLVRKRWVEEEHLAYPLAQVPLELAGEGKGGLSGPLRSRALHLGLLAALGFHLLLGAHRYLPAIPAFQITDVPLVSGAFTLPLSNLEGTGLHFYPSAIGIGFLLGGEVGLSVWLFWLLAKAQLWLLGINGISTAGTTEAWSMQICQRGQQVGAFYCMAALMAWELRHRLLAALRRRKDTGDTPEEQRALRWGMRGALAGTALMWGWCVAAGMTPLLALAAIGLYLVIALVLARLVAQAGVFFAAWSAEFVPADMLAYPLGMNALGKPTSFVIYLHQAIFLNDRRTLTMPFLTDALKIGSAERMPLLRLAAVMLLAIGTSVVVSYAVGLVLYYGHGATNLWDMSSRHIPTWSYDRLLNRWDTQGRPNWPFVYWNGVGVAVMALLVWLQRTFLWWRLSPVGYLMCWSPALEQIAGSFFFGWLASTLSLRYGSLGFYRRARPFFLGLIVGEFLGVVLWLLVDAAAGVTGHALFPSGGTR